MDERDPEDDMGSTRTSFSNTIEKPSNISAVDDFVKYYDSVDDRKDMTRSSIEPGNVKWKKWDYREDFKDEDSDSEEEIFMPRIPRVLHDIIGKKAISEGDPEDVDNTERNVDNISGFSHIRNESSHYPENQREEFCINENSVEDLMKKFSVIQNLRQKEELRKVNELDQIKVNPVIKSRDPSQECKTSQVKNPEAFLGPRKCGKKRHLEKDTDGDTDEEYPEVGDNEIDEIVEMLSKSSLIKDYDEIVTFPKEEDEILKALLKEPGKEEKVFNDTSQIIGSKTSSDCIFGAKSEELFSENSGLDDITSEWNADISRELMTFVDGYEIDDPSSFHDWMLDDILSKSLKSSHESEFKIFGTFV